MTSQESTEITSLETLDRKMMAIRRSNKNKYYYNYYYVYIFPYVYYFDSISFRGLGFGVWGLGFGVWGRLFLLIF